MLEFDSQQVWANARKAGTQDLLNRITVFRGEMDSAAIDIIESELSKRDVDRAQIEEFAQKLRQTAIMRPDGIAYRCSLCREPAIATGWSWHRLFGIVPVVPRFFYWCEKHQPKRPQQT